jgi:hypothetical protein
MMKTFLDITTANKDMAGAPRAEKKRLRYTNGFGLVLSQILLKVLGNYSIFLSTSS